MRSTAVSALAGFAGSLFAEDGGGFGGEAHYQPRQVKRGGELNAEMAGDDLRYFYEFFAKVAFEAPTELHLDIERLLKNLHLHFQPWYKGSDSGNLFTRCVDLYDRVAGLLEVVKVEWDGESVRVDKVAHLEVSRGLHRHFIVEVNNATSEAARLSVVNLLAGYYPMGAVQVPPGQGRGVLSSLLVDKCGRREVEFQVVCEGLPKTAGLVKVDINVSEPAVIKGQVYDKATHGLFPARVYARGSDNVYRHGKAFENNPTLSVKDIVDNVPIGKQQKLPFFYCDGRFEIEVPAGGGELTLERGYEHEIVSEGFEARPGELLDVKLSSGRFADMKARGWISGDTHIHWAKNWWDTNEDIDLLAMVQRAEDLRVANNLTLLQYRPDEQGGTFVKPDQYPMGPVPGYCDREYHIEMGEEYRNDNYYGHICLLNIKKLVQPISTGQGSGGPPGAFDYPLNRDAILQARRQGGISTEAHNLGPFHRSDVPVNAVMGFTDCFDQLEPVHYYRFCDNGLKIPLGNGSDHPARLAGYCRMYVKVDGEFSYAKWIEGIRKRRTFVTSGPLVFITVNGRGIGEVLDVEKGSELEIAAEAMSRRGIGDFEIVTNGGEVIGRVHTDQRRAEIKTNLRADKGRWFAARCSVDGDYYVLNGLGRAHTSAVYVNVEGAGALEREAVEYWVDLLERHKSNVAENANFKNDWQRQRAVDNIQRGLDEYRKLLAKC